MFANNTKTTAKIITKRRGLWGCHGKIYGKARTKNGKILRPKRKRKRRKIKKETPTRGTNPRFNGKKTKRYTRIRRK